MSKVGHAVYRKVDCEQKVLVYSSCAVDVENLYMWGGWTSSAQVSTGGGTGHGLGLGLYHSATCISNGIERRCILVKMCVIPLGDIGL